MTTGQHPRERGVSFASVELDNGDVAKVPLTKTEKRRLANLERRDAKRKRSRDRRQDATERDAQLKAINDEYGPRIQKLQNERAAKLKDVWTQWRRTREERA